MNITRTIDRMELRHELLALDEKRKELVVAADAEEAAMSAALQEELSREEAVWKRESNELWLAFQQRLAGIRKAHGAAETSAAEALDNHDKAAAYDEAKEFDGDGLVVRCVLTGLPLIESDEVITDSEDRMALAAAIVGWPLFESEETDDTADETDAEKIERALQGDVKIVLLSGGAP